MSLSPISSNLVNLLIDEPLKSGTSAENSNEFSDIFNEALNNVADTDKADKASSVQLLAGQADDMSGLLLDAQKAEIALNLTLQLRNKVVDAYNEIMRMQV